jgi:hypothetical protein
MSDRNVTVNLMNDLTTLLQNTGYTSTWPSSMISIVISGVAAAAYDTQHIGDIRMLKVQTTYGLVLYSRDARFEYRQDNREAL